jgi:hypothetical protein
MHTPARPRFVPPPYQDSAESGRLILRDGTTAHVVALSVVSGDDARRSFLA